MLTRRSFLSHAAALPALAANWPEFRGQGDSLTAARRLPLQWGPQQNLAWTAALPGYGQSSPVVHGNRVFVTSIEGENKETLHVLCLDFKTGRELWRRQFPATQPGKNNDMTSKGAPTPCADRDRVYAFFESGDLIALDHNGRPAWHRKLTEEYGPFKGNHGIGSSPRLIPKGIAVLAAHDGPSYLLAIDRATGRNLWRADRPNKTAWTTPTVYGNQIIASVNGRIDSYHTADGRPLWSYDNIKGNLLSSATIAGGHLIAGSSEKGQVVALQLHDTEAPRELWRATNATSYFGSPLVHRERVWLTAKVGVAWCLDAANGEELWNGRIAGECWASPLGAGDHVYLFTVKGVTQVHRAQPPFDKLAENTLPGMERTYGYAVADNSLLLRCGRQLVKVSA
ncbi:MAG: PQQ-binding-like beta-propeller repeat protein [Bryobacterales bacterium]|nr:PQQ-binding-like beta-propeller repeat protein [Bryobacterales bacterium]